MGETHLQGGRKCSLGAAEELEFPPWQGESYGRLRTVTQPQAYKLQKLGCFASQRNRATGNTGGMFQLHGRKQSVLGGVSPSVPEVCKQRVAQEATGRNSGLPQGLQRPQEHLSPTTLFVSG